MKESKIKLSWLETLTTSAQVNNILRFKKLFIIPRNANFSNMVLTFLNFKISLLYKNNITGGKQGRGEV